MNKCGECKHCYDLKPLGYNDGVACRLYIAPRVSISRDMEACKYFKMKERPNKEENVENKRTPETEQLKPCPFCGGKVELCNDDYGKFLIVCKPCKMLFGIEVEDGTELIDGWKAKIDTLEEAVEAWNRRRA